MNDYTAYEYHEIKAPENQMPFYMDCYENFGWEADERTSYRQGVRVLRRDRKLVNKTELTRLQRHFEACLNEIKSLEASRTNKATGISLAVGIVGTAFMAGSVFAVTADTPMILLCIVLAVPAFIGWALAPILYKKNLAERKQVVDQLVKRKYDEIYEICEKGHNLL
jgi:hypothetical protein